MGQDDYPICPGAGVLASGVLRAGRDLCSKSMSQVQMFGCVAEDKLVMAWCCLVGCRIYMARFCLIWIDAA